jgi:deoxyribonuclease IV
MKKLLFGTAGIPLSTKERNTGEGIRQVRKLGLGCMELEFVRGVNIKAENTGEIRNIAKENSVVLSAHSPYWINLNSEDKKKFHASISYVVSAAKIASLCGGWSVCFHAGYYMNQEPNNVYNKIREGVIKIIKEVKEFDGNIWIRPELTGKPSQFGDLQELIKLSQEVEQVMPCIDFAHSFARYGGKRNNTREEFIEMLTKVEKGLGKEALKNMHIHTSGIEYSEKGEKNHLILEESKLDYRELIKVWKDFNISGAVISESPNIEDDSALMMNIYDGLKNGKI